MKTSSTVTVRSKCYIFVCAGCCLLAESSRKDTLTCSTACRVKAHRSGKLADIKRVAASFEISAALILQAKAAQMLVPELAAKVAQGTLTFDDIRADVQKAFLALVFQQLGEEVLP